MFIASKLEKKVVQSRMKDRAKLRETEALMATERLIDYQNVFEADVAVRYVQRVQIVDSRQNLQHHVARRTFRITKLLSGDDAIQQVASLQ